MRPPAVCRWSFRRSRKPPAAGAWAVGFKTRETWSREEEQGLTQALGQARQLVLELELRHSREQGFCIEVVLHAEGKGLPNARPVASLTVGKDAELAEALKESLLKGRIRRRPTLHR